MQVAILHATCIEHAKYKTTCTYMLQILHYLNTTLVIKTGCQSELQFQSYSLPNFLRMSPVIWCSLWSWIWYHTDDLFG